MNRLATPNQNRKYLLGTVSAIALLASVAVPAFAEDGGTDRPELWIELGGSFDQMENAQSSFQRPFVSPPPSFQDFSVTGIEKPSQSALNLDGKITFQPENSDWVFSAEFRFGRSQHGGQKQAQPGAPCHYYTAYQLSFCSYVHAFANAIAKSSERHEILDFKVGKDVGLGFGGNGTSIFSAGLRYVQFKSDMSVQMASQPTNAGYGYNRYTASFTAERSFTGIGPSISWDASAPLVGAPEKGLISFDWGVNGALLFGRQKMNAHQETKGARGYGTQIVTGYDHPASPIREKSVMVPNLGGFAGLSLRYSVAKFSLGYRADMFFGAVDAGIDTRKTYDRGFYGPFANISIGIGG